MMRAVRTTSARGFSIVEAAAATLIVAVMLVASLEAVGSAVSGRASLEQRSRAAILAHDMLGEILPKAYTGAGETASAIGPTPAEAAALRAAFDDVDDFHGLTESQPKDAQGASLAGSAGYTRSVTVSFVSADNPNTVSPTPSGVKRIVVRVVTPGGLPVEVWALRTEGADIARATP